MKALAVALLALALVACKDPGPARVATLLEGQGAVQAEHAGTTAAAPTGQPFFLGDAARTGAEAWARLELRGGAVVRLGADTVVRFVAGGARLESGEATAERAVTLVTEAGAAQLEAGGVLRASGSAAGVRFEVVAGRAILQREDGPLTLEPGAGLVVAMGGAIVERRGGEAPAPVDAGTPEPVASAAAISTIVATVRGRGATARTGTDAARALAAGEVALQPGDAVKLSRGASLELARGADRATVTGPAEIIVGGPIGPFFTARAGAAQVSARNAELAVAVPGGTIVTRAGGDARLAIGRAEATARVERGEVGLDGDTSDAQARAGETGVITRAGAAAVRDAVPTTIDLALPPGEAAVVHDPGREVAVQLDFTGCTAGGVLELVDGKGSFASARRIAGASSAAFFAHAGTSRYRLRCDGGATRTGSIRVAGDTGAAAVVRTPGSNEVEADGRKYWVTYQNRIPQITIRWGEARGPSTLTVKPARGPARTFTAIGDHVLAPGTLGEGSYTLTIAASKRTSPTTTLRIAFDNAAPTAQITAPPPRAEWSDPLVVTGVTVEGWSVEVAGKPADRDASGRFRAEIATAGTQAFAIRLAHPQHGVHYYLRRRR